MNKLDKDYLALCQDILDNGTKKQTRTGTDAISIFGRQIRHKMSDGFPLLTTKKMAWKQIVTELLWFLRGDTNIKFLVDNGCHIWDGDAYKNFVNIVERSRPKDSSRPILSQEEFIDRIKTDDEFAKRWGELGKIYGAQWRNWGGKKITSINLEKVKPYRWGMIMDMAKNGDDVSEYGVTTETKDNSIDQIAKLINDLKTNPDSRRLMVSAWNVGELDQMVLPPCHYGFQVYTRELSLEERCDEYIKRHPKETNDDVLNYKWIGDNLCTHEDYDKWNIPTRAISLMWNQRSVDVPLGLPFNIASYGLLLEIIAKTVNMVPDELIGNLGDCHIYENQIDGVKEQIGRELSLEERVDYKKKRDGITRTFAPFTHQMLDNNNIPTRTREPYPLPTLNINTEFWPTENGSCGEGPLDAIAVFNSFKDENFCKCLLEEDIQLGNYKYHPAIKIPLSN